MRVGSNPTTSVGLSTEVAENVLRFHFEQGTIKSEMLGHTQTYSMTNSDKGTERVLVKY